MIRKEGWESILQDYINEQRSIPFVWGHNDCVLFSARGANAILENDLTPQIELYGEYDEAQALELIRECNGIAGIFDRHLQRRPVKTARRGDIVLMIHNGNKIAGLCNGRQAVCKTMTGIEFISMESALAAWSIGE